MAYKETVIEFKSYNVASEMPMDKNTNSILFTNKGTATVYINSFPLAAGESWGDGRNAGEIITGKFVISFTPGAAVTACLLCVQLTRYKS